MKGRGALHQVQYRRRLLTGDKDRIEAAKKE